MAPLEAALEYATGPGWPVIPLAPGSKLPATANGVKDASGDPHQIVAWFAGTNCGVGIACGYPGPVVLDFDVKGDEGAVLALRSKLAKAGFLKGCGWQVGTPSGGGHMYFSAIEGRDRGFRLRPHLDVQGSGCYVVAPPTRTEAGEYQALTGRKHSAPIDTTALRELLRPKGDSGTIAEKPDDDFAAALAHAEREIAEGISGRHSKIGWLLRRGMPKERVTEWAEQMKPGSASEVEGWVRWLSRQ